MNDVPRRNPISVTPSRSASRTARSDGAETAATIGIPAVVFAAQVNGKWNGGDQAGAIESAAKAKKFAIIALALGIVGTIIYAIAIGAGVMNSDSTGM